jgi:hypothetical protein
MFTYTLEAGGRERFQIQWHIWETATYRLEAANASDVSSTTDIVRSHSFTG